MSDLPFTPRLPLLPYQAAYLIDHGMDSSYALTWEQGVGKTCALINNAALLLAAGKIDGMFVIAPGGVHRNWVVEELPKWWPADAKTPYRAFAWDGGAPWGNAGTKAHTAAYGAFLWATNPENPTAAFGVLTMSYDQLMTDAGKQASWDFLRRRRCLYIADESHRFKTPKAARQKRALASSVYAPYRRIASGTPMDKPFDLYSQVRWLSADFWKENLGIDGFPAFKRHFASWKTIHVAGGRQLDVVAGYRNLDVLWACLQKIGSRVTLNDTGLVLPTSYKRMYHPLSREQARVYQDLKEECLAVLRSGELVTAEMAFTLQMRLSQIGCGFIRPGAGAEDVPFKENSRADAFREYLVGLSGAPAVCWGRFKHDVLVMQDASRRAHRRPVVYDHHDVAGTLEAWRAGEYDDLIANLHSTMIEGYTLTRANFSLYYSNSPRLITRQQSEKRTNRIGQAGTAVYVDFLAEGTADTRALEMLRGKGVVSGTVLGDDPARVLRWLLTDEDKVDVAA